MRRRKQKIEVAEVKNLMPPLKGGEKIKERKFIF